MWEKCHRPQISQDQYLGRDLDFNSSMEANSEKQIMNDLLLTTVNMSHRNM